MLKNYVSLIGRTNVGKSSLFNMLINENVSISTNYSNFTVDSNVACFCTSNNKCFFISDTASIKEVNNSNLSNKIEKNIFSYINSSNLILFVINAYDGITFLDIKISKILRKFNKKVFLIVNKSENFNLYNYDLDFYSLGFKDIFFTSCHKNSGIKSLLHDNIVPFFINKNFFVNYNKFIGNFYLLKNRNVIKYCDNNSIKISILGKPNVGKSTFINSIINEDRVITDGNPGTTTDSTENYFYYKKNRYIFVDTAGVRRSKNIFSNIEKISVKKSISCIKSSDIIMLFLDSTRKISNQDFYLINNIILFEKCFFIVINKWDLLSFKNKIKFKNNFNVFIKKFIFVDYFFISAKKKQNLFSIFNAINNINILLKKNYSSSILTRILKKIIDNHKPPLFNKKKISLKYANLISKKPFRILIHGNRVDGLLCSYKKYLVNSFTKHLNLKGIPLKIFFKKGNNPYI
ncbi:ribosome biogenesis GTPase Der [Buchnera aphidicola (Ceratovacuna keduensis)]|uniref:ribosome biogenesis GTPase Der n=1 Tax=Buchnera aphidicola TaxID=9 RepID=UPI0031B873F0